MDLRLDPSELLLRDNVRRLFSKSADAETLRQWEQSAAGYSTELWGRMAALGWPAVGIIARDDDPSSRDADLFNLGLIIQEIGRSGLPSPFLTSVADAAYAVSRLGTTSRATALVEELAGGSVASFVHDAHDRLVLRDDGTLHGPAVIAEWALAADALVVLARRADSGSPVLLAIEPRTPGVNIENRDTFDNERIAVTSLDGVVAPDGSALAEALTAESVEQTRAASRLLRCAELLGCASAVLDITVHYVKERHQFGVAIGSFQAVQHQLADIAIEVDSARLATYEGLSRLSQGADVVKASALAERLCTRAAVDAAVAGSQFHGGIGTIRDHRMSIYYRRAKAMSIRLGPVPEARSRLLRTHRSKSAQAAR